MGKTVKRVLALIAAVAMIVTSAMVTSIDTKAADLDYSLVFNATYYAAKNVDVATIIGTDEGKLLEHFVTAGMKEGRQGCEEFNVTAYRQRYADLNAAFGDNLRMYYLHYMITGKAEGRNGRVDNVTPATTAKTPATTPATTATTPATTTVNTNIPANSVAYGNGYFLKGVSQEVFQWINTQRVNGNVRVLTWSESMEKSAINRSKEISIVYSSGRPNGTPWSTSYDKEIGDINHIKEMMYQENGVSTAQSIENALANNTDRKNYIMTSDFDKCGISIYTENGKSYVILAFSRLPEKKD